jgi:ABC-2 type transport system ATP-binding protein
LIGWKTKSAKPLNHLFRKTGNSQKEEDIMQHFVAQSTQPHTGTATAPLVEVRNLVKTFKRVDGTTVEAVKGVSLDIRKGEIFSLLGPNGAGKTTVISMISGLVTPTAGDATIGGYSITKQPMKAKQLLGVVPQEIALYETLSARQNLVFFGQMYGMGGRELDQRIEEVFEFIDLKDRQNDRIETFSGGMKRRVNIGVGLLHKPQLVYMDEPTVGVDPQSRRRILETVLRMRDEYKMTVLYTTHLMEEAQELSDRVAIIDQGQIIAMGTQDELTQQVGEEDRLIVTFADGGLSGDLMKRLEAAPTVTHVQVEPVEDDNANTKVTAFARRGRTALPEIIRIAADAGHNVQSVEVREPDLESLFLKLTGRALRD